jgi:hypothetical protein
LLVLAHAGVDIVLTINMFVSDLEHLFDTSDALFPDLLHEVLVTDLAYESLDDAVLRDVVELILPSGEAPDVAVRFCPSRAYNQ